MFRRLSLKARLHLATVTMVLSLVFVLAGLNLHRALELTFQTVEDRAQANANQLRDLLIQRIDDRAVNFRPRPSDLDETKAMWTKILIDDPLIPRMLQQSGANSHLVADILITGADSVVLTASNPAHAGANAPNLPDYLQWQKRPLWDRVVEIFSKNQDYSIRIPLGVPEEGQEIFSIRIITSSPLLKDAVRPELQSVAYLSALAIGLSLAYAFVFSNLMLRPLARIGETIDRMAQGEYSADPLRQTTEPHEFADLQSKLGVLGKQVRGAREDADQLRSKIDQLLQQMEEVVLLFDETEHLIMAGRPAERLFRLTRDELIGMNVRELFPDDTSIGSSIRTAVQFRKPLTDMLVRYRMPRGEEVNFLLSLDWNMDQMLVTLRDAESRKALASHLDLSSRLAAISRLTGGVAHEIKNPLNAIAINLEVLKSRLSGDNSPLQQEVEVISKEIARLDRVVKTFLNFTRPIEVKLTTVDATELLREAGQLVEVQAARNNVAVTVLVPEERLHAWADTDLLKQALMNIVMNAIEAMPQGGPLYLRLLREGTEVFLEVEDRGGGIPEAVQEKVFQLYFTTKEEGSGIGLAVAYQAVQLMGGLLIMRSQPGFGTLFRIGLPGIDVEEEVPDEEPEPISEQTG
ncbi:MAG: HAMP domain-containing protein [Acidobacteria bacterium]|nr:HAMP domain-containing protein [Acidobacteriota bacterium]